ncbi:hypothetical protein HNQ91_002994 [Filimonas zeae]|uniref:Uncharacterized protein n=1 Tax=Filimonas zeae TaxID=1737353 RepID=A0A917J0S0_9BACT|nr:hypothetical protein [Filimonas zeae]MDR6339929.1 hypothetical protein [Filimonas zeae]GGH70336.1 hypothetical protein GCM10011379_28510 [Filimonas zeae]
MNAKDLLNKYLDYNHLWASPERINTKPANIRRLQIEALQKAFKLTKDNVNPLIQTVYSSEKHRLNRTQYLSQLTNLQYLLQGEFLHDRNEEANKELLDRITSKISSLYPGVSDSILYKTGHIHWLFNNLLNFRKEVFKITSSGSGMSEGFSSGLQYSYYLQAKLKESISDNLTEIDDTLWLILDPARREVRIDEINYPDVDLASIDMEWKMEGGW